MLPNPNGYLSYLYPADASFSIWEENANFRNLTDTRVTALVRRHLKYTLCIV